jgi:hypothetical protein
MTTYVTQGPAHAGAVISLAAPGGTATDFAPTGQGVGLLMSAGTTATCTVVLPFTPTYDGQVVTPRTFTITAGQTALMPLDASVYGPGVTAVQYTNITTIQVASITIP